MKISGPGAGPTPEAPNGPSETKGPGSKDFAQKLEGPGKIDASVKPGEAVGVEGAKPATEVGGPQKAAGVADISADLKAGRVTPQKALDRVIDRILDRQLGAHAAPDVREKVAAALRETLETDPMLAEKLRRLSGG